MAGYMIKAVIEDTHPPVWRRIVIPEKISFRNLHSILQVVFQWEDAHMHEFTFPKSDGYVVMKGESDSDTAVEEEQVLADEFFRLCKWIRYTYDFGDDWRHKLIFEKEAVDYDSRCAKVIKYKGDSFEEDSGGVWGGQGDRIHFDTEQINKELQELSFPVQKEEKEGKELLELIQMEYAWSDFAKSSRQKARELAQAMVDKLHNESLTKKKADKDSEMAEKVHRWIDFYENKEMSGEGELLKNVSQRSCKELLATMDSKGIQEYCKYMGVRELAVDDISQCARVVWEELKGHPEYLAYVFSWDELRHFMEFIELPNGICAELPDMDVVMKALALGLFDLSEEWVNRSSYLVLRQTVEVRELLNHYTQAEWKRICKKCRRQVDNCNRLLNLYSMMELEAFCQKYQAYYDSAVSREEIQRCIYLSGTFCKELMTADTPEGVSYVAESLIDMNQVLMAQNELECDVDYRDFSFTERKRAEGGFGELYPAWGECFEYIVREYGMDVLEAEELLQPLYYGVKSGRGADMLWEWLQDSIVLEDVEGYVTFWEYFLGACLTTGIPQLKGYSREEYGHMAGIDVTKLGVYENSKSAGKILKTAHLYEMPLEFQMRIYKIIQRSEGRKGAGELELLLQELDNGNYELEYLLGGALVYDGEYEKAEKYFRNIQKAFPKDAPVKNILNNIRQAKKFEEEEELSIWDMMDGKQLKSDVDTYRRTKPKIGRNDPCPCGSGKKYKKCCGR